MHDDRIKWVLDLYCHSFLYLYQVFYKIQKQLQIQVLYKKTNKILLKVPKIT